ncbi:MAG: PEP-CTERM sorting domain-containing protein [Verrucomicrobiota bacterium]
MNVFSPGFLSVLVGTAAFGLSAHSQFTFDMTTGGSGLTANATFQFDVVADTVVQTAINPDDTNSLSISGSGGSFGAISSTGTFEMTIVGLGDNDTAFNPVDWSGGSTGNFIETNNANGWGLNDGGGGLSIGAGEAIIFEFDTTNLNLVDGEFLAIVNTRVRDTSANLNLQYRNVAGTPTTPIQIIDGSEFAPGSSVIWPLNNREVLDGDQFAFWAEGSGTKSLKDWQFVIVPEPSAYASLIGLGAFTLVLLRRRR